MNEFEENIYKDIKNELLTSVIDKRIDTYFVNRNELTHYYNVGKMIVDAQGGDERAKLALRMYNDRVSKYIADYYIELEGNVDAIIFTAGVGENGSDARSEMIKKLAPLGIKLDEEMNSKVASFKEISEGIISSKDSKIPVWVVPTNEELMIIKDTYKFVK